MARKRWRRFFRYGTRTLLALVLLAAVPLALHMNAVQNQRRATVTVRQFGGAVYLESERATGNESSEAKSPWPDSVVSFVGPDVFYDVEVVDLVAEKDTGKWTYNEQKADQVVESFVDDLPDLERLRLYGNQATDEGLRQVGQLKHLRRLFLYNATAITDEGIRHLHRLDHLEYLHIDNSQITDESLAVLAQLPRLDTLVLRYNHLSNNGLAQLQDMPQLRALCVGGASEISDAGLANLTSLANLEHLDIEHTLVTDDGLSHLLGLKKLRWMHLKGSRVTDVSALRQAIPGCEIHGLTSPR